jgi:hypothetical protein
MVIWCKLVLCYYLTHTSISLLDKLLSVTSLINLTLIICIQSYSSFNFSFANVQIAILYLSVDLALILSVFIYSKFSFLCTLQCLLLIHFNLLQSSVFKYTSSLIKLKLNLSLCMHHTMETNSA